MLRKIVEWLAFRMGCRVIANAELVKQAMLVSGAQRINEKAEKVAAYAEELLEENKQLRAAYDALLEEMAELTEGQSW